MLYKIENCKLRGSEWRCLIKDHRNSLPTVVRYADDKLSIVVFCIIL